MYGGANDYFDIDLWEKIVSSGRQKTCAKGERLLSKGKACPGLICLKDGKVKIFSETADSNEKIFGLLVAPAMFGETEAFDQGPCMISAVALTKIEIAVVNLAALRSLMAENLRIAHFLIYSIGAKLRWTTYQAADMTCLRTRNRLASLLLGHGKYAVFTYNNDFDVLSMTHEEIASFIGCTRPKVTVLLKEFAREGLIETKRNQIKILDREALKVVVY
ncbi:MAG: Crp/Fnr family transcriptional regulator [Gracilibacteraceae bacterium]|nr:Crp/Fnr family transcriptional regulator [Gracilibacteraceae bacterium]